MFFERIGVYGLAEVEDLLWAGALTGDPVLLVGSAGSAKTKIIEAMGKVLRMRTKVYNCAAINFEDLIGYVLPNKEGTEMEIIPSPYAIHDVEVLGLDEISRTRVDRQNDMLSIIRERRIQGKLLNDLKIIIGAMNPIQDVDGDSYEGAEPLDKAFAERFSTTILIKPFLEMDPVDQARIITATGTGDAVSLKYWKSHDTAGSVNVAPVETQGEVMNVMKTQSEEELEKLSKEVYTMLSAAAQSYESYNSTWNEAVTNYIKDFATALGKGERGRRISGRSAGMIYRNILSLAAINKAMAPDLNIKMEDIAYKAVLHSFPDISYSDAVDDGKILAAHKLAKHHLTGLVEELSLAEIKKEKDPIQRVFRALNGVKIGSQDLSTLIKESLDELKEKDPAKASMFAHTVFYELQDKDFIQATVLVELGKEVRRLGLNKNNGSGYGSKGSSSDLNTKIQKSVHDGLKTMLGKAKSENEKTLMIKSALIYSEMLPEMPNLKEKDIKPLEDKHEEFVKMLKLMKGVSKKSKVKI